MVRIAIIIPGTQRLFVEDLTDKQLERYESIDDYIEFTYDMSGGYYWTYVCMAEYISADDKTTTKCIDFENL